MSSIKKVVTWAPRDESENGKLYMKLFLFTCGMVFFLFLRSHIEIDFIQDLTTVFMVFSVLAYFMNFLLTSAIITERDLERKKGLVLITISTMRILEGLSALAAVLLFAVDVPYYASLIGQFFQISFLSSFSSLAFSRTSLEVLWSIVYSAAVANVILIIALVLVAFLAIFTLLRLEKYTVSTPDFDVSHSPKANYPDEESFLAPREALGYFYWWSFAL